MRRSQLKIGFNLLGEVYNPIKRLILGVDPELVITHAISKVKPSGNVLVIGGGADNTVLELLKITNVNAITLLDISSVLLDKAKERIKSHSHCADVKMEESLFLDFKTNSRFDFIICPFYLDLFSDKEVRENIRRIKELLPPTGEVVVIDFLGHEESSTVNKRLIAILYLMFWVITGTFRFKIPSYSQLFRSEGFELTQNEIFKGRYQILSFRKKPGFEQQ